ncbi:putative BTB/POZ domain-containing adapter for CUL3-mediated RhoA degradation protein 3-like [Scophthalmus maximus]|uniref:Putative BTB/POZ domain-containing adapter for CUL3-mediated RhoA degradation protein 3-like n=1 Tax=Scophthalmus maximus TaxID=52904 RepID=A0A2U9CQA0_SCOMX|nr:putative BTB/POZ domain-containing adapter for CUL3-mediated RhoA degradation protein 3-like [Scophthalmus maximus]
MSAEASAGSHAADSVQFAVSQPACHNTDEHRSRGLLGSKYVKLNVGGSLHYTTVQTLSKEDSLLRSICNGGTEATIDSEGWVMLDRCGRHFGLVLNFLRDGSVPLPEDHKELDEVLKEAQYYRVQGLIQHCLSAVQKQKDVFETVCRIPMITSAKEEQKMIATCRKPVVKLQNNRGNNKYSYTSNSDDNLLKNIELFDKLVLRFNGRVLFVKDVLGDEICCWSFYGEGRKIAEVCCTSIVYATEKKQTKVEFPEARIFEETLNILIYENGRGSGPGGLHLLDSRGSGSSLGQSEEEGAAGGDRRCERTWRCIDVTSGYVSCGGAAKRETTAAEKRWFPREWQQLRQRTSAESEDEECCKKGSEESVEEDPTKPGSGSEEAEQEVKKSQRKTNGKLKQRKDREDSTDEEVNESEKKGNESNCGDSPREMGERKGDATKNGETSPGKKTPESDGESETEADKYKINGNESSDNNEKEEKVPVEKKNNDADSDSSSLPSLDDDKDSGAENNQDGDNKKKTLKKEENNKKERSGQKDDNKAVVRLKRYIALCGVKRNYKKLLDGCRSVRSMVAVLKKELEDLGVHGNPSIKKCKSVKVKREEDQELAELDVSNIIATQGRPKRRGALARQEHDDPPSSTYKRTLNSGSDSDRENEVRKGHRRATDWANLQGIISDDADSD